VSCRVGINKYKKILQGSREGKKEGKRDYNKK
jgi:hypothetical protein